MNAPSSITTGAAWSGSSTPPMPTPPARCTPAPICAHEPTVAQVSTIVSASDPRPDVHVARHQHDAPGQERPVPRRRRRHHAHTQSLVPVLEGQLVVVLERPGLAHLEAADPEVEQHGLLHPRVHQPARPVGLRHTDLAPIQHADRRLDGLVVEAGPPDRGSGRPSSTRRARDSSATPITRAPRSRPRRGARPRARTRCSVGTIAMRTYPSPSGRRRIRERRSPRRGRSGRAPSRATVGRRAPRSTGRRSRRCRRCAHHGRANSSRKTRRFSAYRARLSSTWVSSFHAAIEARCTNSWGVTPTLGRSALRAPIRPGSPAANALRYPVIDDRLLSVLIARTLVRSPTCSADTGGGPSNQSSLYASSEASNTSWWRHRSAAWRRKSSDATAPVGLFG